MSAPSSQAARRAAEVVAQDRIALIRTGETRVRDFGRWTDCAWLKLAFLDGYEAAYRIKQRRLVDHGRRVLAAAEANA